MGRWFYVMRLLNRIVGLVFVWKHVIFYAVSLCSCEWERERESKRKSEGVWANDNLLRDVPRGSRKYNVQSDFITKIRIRLSRRNVKECPVYVGPWNFLLLQKHVHQRPFSHRILLETCIWPQKKHNIPVHSWKHISLFLLTCIIF